MTVTEQRPERSRSASAVALAGLDRLLWQRIELDDHGPLGALVSGTRRRRPASVRVDADTAMALLDAGVPTVTRRVESGS